MSDFVEKGSIFLNEKVSGKGSLLILENDHMSPPMQRSGGTGFPATSQTRSSLLKVPVIIVECYDSDGPLKLPFEFVFPS